MKKLLWTTTFVVIFFLCSTVSAAAVVNDTVKVGLRYGSDALFSANLENAVGEGYAFGYFDEDRSFVSLGETDETAISMSAAGTMYMSESGGYSREMPSGTFRYFGPWHVQLAGYDSFEDAASDAGDLDGWVAWISGAYVVRVGGYETREEAQSAAGELGGSAEQSSATGVLVTRTKSLDVLFEFDCQGTLDLGVLPQGRETATWFKGYKYPGGFSYPRITGGNLNVTNLVELETYVKGVIPYEMSGSWPLSALEAQAVCARTFACRESKHLASYGFDVCAGTDCQVYYGVGSGGAGPTATSDEAVDNTAGECLYYDGAPIRNAVYHSSDGGATEDAYYVWGTETGYLKGKQDPYESQTTIPNYAYSVTYTADELTCILQQKNYDVGTIRNVYVSEFTPLGNVYKVTFEHDGGTLTVKGDTCRTIFYSSTYNKSVRSLRFTINGASAPSGGSIGPSTGGGYYVNGSGETLRGLDGASVISGSGTVSKLEGEGASVITSSGTATLGGSASNVKSSASGTFTITGTGYGHNVGMSQYGAKAMAEQGWDYEEILHFYFTDVTIE
ncbi:SpoIID/LytB domain-containing protein [Oscillibacter sp.]|uniref:SpoIID/LytB domain-containing protein n=1 Tax=Oscillibacter sp. TaxID=1945593 RepID=UPI00260F09F5|nr:SpoIID/LytB domain-containing protein [Oscillibacter sp.]MDD3347944.1 SpoIID/LytB domain-containing protein [Oscillibacter sp.]